jgi:hypothetical protein
VYLSAAPGRMLSGLAVLPDRSVVSCLSSRKQDAVNE